MNSDKKKVFKETCLVFMNKIVSFDVLYQKKFNLQSFVYSLYSLWTFWMRRIVSMLGHLLVVHQGHPALRPSQPCRHIDVRNLQFQLRLCLRVEHEVVISGWKLLRRKSVRRMESQGWVKFIQDCFIFLRLQFVQIRAELHALPVRAESSGNSKNRFKYTWKNGGGFWQGRSTIS